LRDTGRAFARRSPWCCCSARSLPARAVNVADQDVNEVFLNHHRPSLCDHRGGVGNGFVRWQHKVFAVILGRIATLSWPAPSASCSITSDAGADYYGKIPSSELVTRLSY
jgi:hypothetical protein